ncbi:MAG TPA: hypothetical protein VLF89_03015 [Candidatus Saccharimonadales bacterium]|nr:hypothetical protein [Candidatus Saccharimonadales bacterium]
MKQQEINQKIKLLYFQYRDFFVPVITIFVCIVVCLYVIVPQIQSYFALQNQFLQDQQQLQVLQQNFQKVTGLSDQQLNTNFNTTTAALPELKNATVVLNTISKAASVSNISLKDYTFAVGVLTKTKSSLPLHVTLSVNGNKDKLQKFVQQLSVSLPLSEITSIDIQDNDATINIVFYMQAASQSSINTSDPLQLLTNEDRSTLDLLSSWQ